MPPAEAGVRDRLMDAAEMLVALHGQAGASSRAITQAAGQRHNSAITYHFGSRQGLLDGVWSRGAGVVNRRRAEMLAEHEGAPRLPELLDIYLEPLVAYVGSRSPSYWARFNEEEMRGYPLRIVPELRRRLSAYANGTPLDVLLGVFVAMEDALTAAGRSDGGLRVASMNRYVIAILAAWERDAERGAAEPSVLELAAHVRAGALALLEVDA